MAGAAGNAVKTELPYGRQTWKSSVQGGPRDKNAPKIKGPQVYSPRRRHRDRGCRMPPTGCREPGAPGAIAGSDGRRLLRVSRGRGRSRRSISCAVITAPGCRRAVPAGPDAPGRPKTAGQAAYDAPPCRNMQWRRPAMVAGRAEATDGWRWALFFPIWRRPPATLSPIRPGSIASQDPLASFANSMQRFTLSRQRFASIAILSPKLRCTPAREAAVARGLNFGGCVPIRWCRR
jgi:hypothetical protein